MKKLWAIPIIRGSLFILCITLFFISCTPYGNVGINSNIGGVGNARVSVDSSGRIGVGANATINP